jgi:hypothetical protein
MMPGTRQVQQRQRGSRPPVQAVCCVATVYCTHAASGVLTGAGVQHDAGGQSTWCWWIVGAVAHIFALTM